MSFIGTRLAKLRAAVGHGLMVAVEVAGMLAAGSGAALAVAMGRLFGAAVLGALALGFFLRIVGRRGAAPLPPPPPAWARLAAALLSLIETAVLVEATNLPVRLTQPGFEKLNWLLVLAALVVLYLLQFRFFRSLRRSRGNAVVAGRSS